jgi:D-glycero-D-manno-heptose 1,7-bisphosphate phosphatase
MLREAGKRMNLDLSNSWIIGDRASDLAAGQAASLRGGVLVVTGYGQKERETALELGDQRFAVRVSPNLAAAVEVPIAWVCEAEC